MNAEIVESRIAFYKKDIDAPHSVNGFRGTWNFSDHNLIPDVLKGFLMRHFDVSRLRRVPLQDINKVMNEVWEGPGSLEKIFRLELEMEESGRKIKYNLRDFSKKKQKNETDEDEFEDLPDLPLNDFEYFGGEDELESE